VQAQAALVRAERRVVLRTESAAAVRALLPPRRCRASPLPLTCTRYARFTCAWCLSSSHTTRNWMIRSGIWMISNAFLYSGYFSKKGASVLSTSCRACREGQCGGREVEVHAALLTCSNSGSEGRLDMAGKMCAGCRGMDVVRRQECGGRCGRFEAGGEGKAEGEKVAPLPLSARRRHRRVSRHAASPTLEPRQACASGTASSALVHAPSPSHRRRRLPHRTHATAPLISVCIRCLRSAASL